MTFQIPYKGNLPWLQERTILFVRHGSHAYNLNIETSDEDFKGVCIPPKEYLYGFMNQFEQAEGKDPDCVVYDLRKFMRLAADNNPSIIEVLWAEPLICTPEGERLREVRDSFLSKKAKFTFSGYAHQQLNRIERHYGWHNNPPKAPPTRAEFGLPERTVMPADQLAAAQAAINKQLLEWSTDFLDSVDPGARIAVTGKMTEILSEMKISMDDNAWIGAARTIGYDDNMIEILDRERRYNSKKKEWEAYLKWKKERNPARAELEQKYGYDTKHATHLVRLMRMCREILTEGKVIVARPDRDELLSIRRGAWKYEDLIAWAKAEDAELEELYKTSSVLPHTCDRTKLDELCVSLVRSFS